MDYNDIEIIDVYSKLKVAAVINQIIVGKYFETGVINDSIYMLINRCCTKSFIIAEEKSFHDVSICWW